MEFSIVILHHNYTSLEQELDELENGQEPTIPQAATTSNTNTTTTFASNTQPNNNNNKPTVLELYAAQKKKKSKSQKDRQEAMVQALLYICVFLLSYIFSAVYNGLDQSGKSPSYYLLLTSQVFYPLQGMYGEMYEIYFICVYILYIYIFRFTHCFVCVMYPSMPISKQNTFHIQTNKDS